MFPTLERKVSCMMKKFLFALLMACALLCLCGTAMAAGHPCDSCGGSTSLVGTGNWCHWYCEKCDYTTSRNHDPNSYYSGLVPDSCSGYCQWCGSGANFSAHSFVTYVSDNNAQCLADGTETSTCANEGCSNKHTRTEVGSALGHDDDKTVVPSGCQEEGYTIYTCKRCGDVRNLDITPPLGHAYGQWIQNGDGTHTANCTRQDCYHFRNALCTTTTIVVGARELTMCPVCGHITSESGENVDMDTSDSVSAKPIGGGRLPGKLMVLVDAAPLEVQVDTEAFYMFIVSFQKNGQTAELESKVEISIDLNQHPFQMESRVFVNATPADLNGRAFKIVRVEHEIVDGEEKEVWYDMPFSLIKGHLTFETEKTGTFLMVLSITDAPEAK